MSDLPLTTPSLDSRLSPLSFSICGLLAVGCQLPLPVSPCPSAHKWPINHKSFIRNAYKKHGVGDEREVGAMSSLPLSALSLCLRISSVSSQNRRLLAAGCKLPLPPKTLPTTFARLVKPKSFVRNVYKKHGGVGECVARLAPHSARVTSVTRSDARNSNLFMRLLDDSLDTRGVGGCPPPSPLQSPLAPLTFSLQLSAPPTPPRLTARRTRVTEHGSRITPP
jgi:hypothetical protein